MVSVVLPLLSGPPDSGDRRYSNQPVARHPAPRRSNQKTLPPQRPPMPSAAAPGRAPLGLRQPENMTKVLLTGATGYVGGRFLNKLESEGYSVRCLARRPEYLKTKVGP